MPLLASLSDLVWALPGQKERQKCASSYKIDRINGSVFITNWAFERFIVFALLYTYILTYIIYDFIAIYL